MRQDILPDCMMPDGTDPCKGYQDLQDRIDTVVTAVRAATQELAELHGVPRDQVAVKRLEFFVGHDKIVRINADGICALRIRLRAGCRVELLGPDHEVASTMVAT